MTFAPPQIIAQPRDESDRRAFVPAPDGSDLVPPAQSQLRRGDTLIEFDELYPFVVDGSVTDVLAVGGSTVWIDRGHGLIRTSVGIGEARLRELAVRLVALGGRHVDESTPFADVEVGDGIRVHVMLAPLSVAGTAISIRLPGIARISIADLDQAGFFGASSAVSGRVRAVVEEAVRARTNVLISGATASGKTTLLGAMLSLVPRDERIVIIEDVSELRLDHPHAVALQARQANTEGAGGIGVDRLVREALRMRPDRLVVGERRGAEVRDLMSALNTGHRGGAGTIHANGLMDVPARLEALGMLAGLGPLALARQAASAFELVLQVERGPGGVRRLAAAGTLGLDREGRLTISASLS